ATAVYAAVPRIDTAGMTPYVTAEASPRSASLHYMPDGESFLRISPDRKAILRYDVKSGKQIDTLMNVKSTRTTKINRVGGFTMSADGKKFLVYEDAEMIYRNSFKAKYYLYDAYRNTLRPLSEDHPAQQAPVFSPDARMVAFMADDNNIYLKKLDYWTEVAVTTDGKVNEVINGVPDWTYQEEFKLLNSMVWSPDNTTLCFIKFNEKSVRAFSFPLYQGSCDPMNQYALYPGSFTYKYPVAGEVNSKVSVHSYDVANRKTKRIALPDTSIEYIPRIDYGATAEQLVVTTLNRDQNRMELYMVNPKSTVVKSILVEKWKAWINPDSYESTVYGPDGFVMMSDRTGYTHLYKYSYNGQLLKTMTNGNYDVTAYYGTAADGSYYYQSTGGDPLNRV
ncbi:MAG: DPP IV N-terminal domain-containing protein, partial [Muribaculaceae bacterium]|nr:DPP IV N-terminal domain-containing protein [Muribaculaceae bacterium]